MEELEQVRITAEVVVVEDQETETLIAHSQQSSLVFLPVGLREGQLFDSAGTPIDDFLLRLPLVAMVLAAEDIQLDAEPDEGVAGQLAEAEDVVTAAEQRATDAEIEQHKTKQLFAESLKEFIEARQKNLSVEEITALDGELKNSEEERDKAIRRAAKADAKIEHAKKELELLRKRHHVSEDTT